MKKEILTAFVLVLGISVIGLNQISAKNICSSVEEPLTYTITIHASVKLGEKVLISADTSNFKDGESVSVAITGTNDKYGFFKLSTQDGENDIYYLDEIHDTAVLRNRKKLKLWLSEMKKICAGESVYQLSEAQIKSLQEIDLNILYSVTSRYCFFRFNMVVEFYQEHHHLDMVCADGKNLSVWVRAQRYRYREGKLPQLYLDAIRKHGLMEMLEKPLDVTIRHIEEYYREHGNVDIENAYVSPDGFPLGDRVRALRDKHVNSRNKSAYPQEVIDHLNEMGMIWNKNDYIWQQNYKTCKAYLEESGGYILPYEMLTESGTSMRTWVLSNRRTLMQGKQPAERAELLESIHISEIDFTEPLQKLVRKYTGVSIERDRIWMENYQKCKECLAEHDEIPYDMLTVNGKSMTEWIAVNRSRYRHGKLSEKRAALLEEIHILQIRLGKKPPKSDTLK